MTIFTKIKEFFTPPRTTVVFVDTIEDVYARYGNPYNYGTRQNNIIILTNLEPEEDICPICREQMDEDGIITECNHKFHKDCLKIWIRMTHSRSKCPMCNQNLTIL